MRVFTVLLVLVAGISAPAQPGATDGMPRVRIILVGDSTVAARNGWGPGFCALAPKVDCLNLAMNGRSTSSYRAEGRWANVMKKLENNSGFTATYVLIQFGHNDQPGKPGRSTDLATEFPANMRRYADEVKAAGGNPILVTPLVRRIFKDGRVEDTLEPWADATRKVAKEAGIPVLELNADSAAYVQKIGPVEANTLAMVPPPPDVAASALTGNSAPVPKRPTTGAAATSSAPVFDYTHLGEKGSAVFGRMVASELIKAVPALRPYIQL